MDYLKKIFHQFQINDSQSENASQTSPEESGQFQVIEFDDDYLLQYDKQNCNSGKKGVSPGQNSQAESPLRKLSIIKGNSTGPINNEQQRLINERLSKEYTIIQLDPMEHEDFNLNNGSASTIKIDEYYMIVNSQQLARKFTSQQQWQNFYKKINDFNLRQVESLNSNNCSSIESSKQPSQQKEQKISLTFKQLNSILQIRPQQIQRRQQYWNSIVVPSINIRFKHTELANKKDPKKLQQNVTRIMDSLTSDLLFQIADKKYKPIENVEDQLEKWRACLIKLLTFYGANDKQIGYSKGLQYIALGILVARPFNVQKAAQSPETNNFLGVKSTTPQALSPSYCTSEQSSSQQQYNSLQSHFKYLMFTRHLRNMYFPGTPKLYQQIELLTQLMRSQIPTIYQRLQEMKVDFIKLFINYYKTFLMYKIKNPEVVRKVMELLVIYGIDIVKIILTRIMSRNEKKIMQMMSEEIKLLRYIAEALVDDYFANSETEDVIVKFKQLFVLDAIA